MEVHIGREHSSVALDQTVRNMVCAFPEINLKPMITGIPWQAALYDNRVSIQTIRDYLGHNNENMTKQYIDYVPKRIEQANTDYFRQPGNALAAGIIPKKRGEKTGK